MGDIQVGGYDLAVREVADRLADRTHFVISTCEHHVAEVATMLDGFAGTVGLFDSGQHAILRLTGPLGELGGIMPLLGLAPLAAIVLLPKTTPASALRVFTAQPIAADGSQDIIVARDADGLAKLPRLLVDALNRIDPAFVARLAALDVRRQS
jgi:hypothetical protein